MKHDTDKNAPGGGAAGAQQQQKNAYQGSSKNSSDANQSKEGWKALELTVFTKAGGPLTKRIALAADGSIESDGSACTMSAGRARRAKIAGIEQLAALIERLHSDQAIALGALRPDLPDDVEVTTKNKLDGRDRSNIIARTSDDVFYREQQPALVLFDFDTKGMPTEVGARLAAVGGMWNALVVVLPDLARAAYAIRRSTSAGLKRIDTGQELAGSNGLHTYIVARDGADAERFLKTLHERCWLKGYGWMMVGAAGQLLDRSIVDRMVGAGERLVFEGPPILTPPLIQDAEARRAITSAGEVIDTLAACPPLTLVERQTLRKLQAEASQRLLPERNRIREIYIAQFAERTGRSKEEARRVIECQSRGVLLSDVPLLLDAPEAIGITVAHVLDDPAAFEGQTLADPIEGVEYGRGKAKIMRSANGAPWIHSFAHGQATYQLKYDARAVRLRINDSIDAFVRLALVADLDEVETKQIIDEVSERSGVGVRTITAKLKTAKQEQAQRRSEEARERRLAQRIDPRPQIPCPAVDAPWLPQMQSINEVVVGVTRCPRRNIDGAAARKRRFPVPNTHAFTSNQENNS